MPMELRQHIPHVQGRITFDLNAGNGRAIATLVNGMEAEFSQPLNNGDRVEIYWKEK